MTTIFRRLRSFFGRSRHDADLREESRSHRALVRTDRACGLTPDDAAAQVAAHWQSSRSPSTMRVTCGRFARSDHVWQDVRGPFGGRARARLRAVASEHARAGIAPTGAVFSLQQPDSPPLPVRDPGSLALLTNGWVMVLSDLKEWATRERAVRRRIRVAGEFDLSVTGQRDLVDGAYVSGRIFDVLGVTPYGAG